MFGVWDSEGRSNFHLAVDKVGLVYLTITENQDAPLEFLMTDHDPLSIDIDDIFFVRESF